MIGGSVVSLKTIMASPDGTLMSFSGVISPLNSKSDSPVPMLSGRKLASITSRFKGTSISSPTFLFVRSEKAPSIKHSNLDPRKIAGCEWTVDRRTVPSDGGRERRDGRLCHRDRELHREWVWHDSCGLNFSGQTFNAVFTKERTTHAK